MGRPPTVTASNTRCRFVPEEVAEMERLLVLNNGLTPSRSVQEELAQKFNSAGAPRNGRAPVRAKQVWNWFQNRRYKLSKMDKEGTVPSSSGQSLIKCTAEQLLGERANGMQFEAISSKDGAWYDVRSFLSHKITEKGNPEVFVRYAGLDGDEEEWFDLKSIRRRSLPCEGFECLAVCPGDNVLCFQEGDEHALYYDARVIDVYRKRHDSRGCRCRFWIRYDHDQFEEVVALRKVCRRPETDSRLKEHFETNPRSTDAEKQQKVLHRQEDEEQRNRHEGDEEEVEQRKESSPTFSSERKMVCGGLAIDLNESPPAASSSS